MTFSPLDNLIKVRTMAEVVSLSDSIDGSANLDRIHPRDIIVLVLRETC